VTVSAGAACASRERKGSHVLRAIGLDEGLGVIRVTLSRETTEEEIDAAVDAVADSVKTLRT